VLSDIPAQSDDRVLLDFRTADDAGVYRWEGGPALVQTVDFFTPIVDDPYTYGQIAAANAVSDIYAMGGRPLTALAIAAFPEEGLELDTIRAIFLGGFDKRHRPGTRAVKGRREGRRRPLSHQAARYRYRRDGDQVRAGRPGDDG
jgi:selenide,water dikinase